MKFVFAFYDRGGLAFANALDGFADAVDFGVGGDERGHGVNVIAEGAQPNAGILDDFQDVVGRRLCLEFQYADGSENAHVGGIFEAAERFEVCTKAAFDALDFFGVVAALEQIERGDACRTCQRVRHVGGTVHECGNFAVRDNLCDFVRCDAGGHGNASAGKRLANAHDVGLDVIAVCVGGMHHRESRARAEKSGGDFVEDEQDAFFVAKLAETF